MQTVSNCEQLDWRFDITDTFKMFLLYGSGKDEHESILSFGGP